MALCQSAENCFILIGRNANSQLVAEFFSQLDLDQFLEQVQRDVDSEIKWEGTGEEVDLSGWFFSSGVEYTFPEGTKLASGAYLLVAESPE